MSMKTTEPVDDEGFRLAQTDPDESAEVSIDDDVNVVRIDRECSITLTKGRMVGLALTMGAFVAVIVVVTVLTVRTEDCTRPGSVTLKPGCSLTCSALDDPGLAGRVHGSNISARLETLLGIAFDSGGHRSVGTLGYNRSLDYVKAILTEETDFMLTKQPFTYQKRLQMAPPLIAQLEPALLAMDYEGKEHVRVMTGSGSRDVTGLAMHPANLGCNQADFGAFISGAVAVVKRGNCTFALKAQNAVAAGAVAVVIYNSGANPEYLQIFGGTLGSFEADVPVVSVAYILGAQQFSITGTILRVVTVESELQTLFTANLCAESLPELHGGKPDSVVVVGSHLDSVPAGPGINDNGSGSMMILEIAVQLAHMLRHARVKLTNKVRFCWWGAEEVGLKGSEFYVQALKSSAPEELARIALALNFDMVGSPNFIRGVYNGTMGHHYGGLNSEYVGNSSEHITDLMVSYFEQRNLSFELTDFNGRSDYGPFLDVGIPAGGLDTGADGIKTEEERHRFGGMVGVQHDPCYHLKCDTVENLSQQALSDMSGAAAFAIERILAAPNLRTWLSTTTEDHLAHLSGALHSSDEPHPDEDPDDEFELDHPDDEP